MTLESLWKKLKYITVTLRKAHSEDGVDDDKAQKISSDHPVNHDDKRADNLDTSENNEDLNDDINFFTTSRHIPQQWVKVNVYKAKKHKKKFHTQFFFLNPKKYFQKKCF